MAVSLHVRNPLVTHGGDDLLRLLLFWGMFLPLGAGWSVDRLRAARAETCERLVSIGSAALLLQVCFVYWFTAALKSDPVWWKEGTAVYYALSLDALTKPLGQFLLRFPTLLRFLTFATLAIEVFAPTLLISPVFTGRMRLVGLGGLLALQVGLMLCLELGLFPVVGLLGLVPFVPGSIWDRLLPVRSQPWRTRCRPRQIDGIGAWRRRLRRRHACLSSCSSTFDRCVSRCPTG
ncbi:MAG: HTTM domain-containing protein, partial [Planctomycetes bacterium]|nr:HTTM domain-containing protein [Planctomycetota bacterium]